jgi:hypothetical protein
MDELLGCVGFEWDEGNADKNLARHGVTRAECEQVVFNRPLVVAEGIGHSQGETRFLALGQTDVGRLLFIAATVREDRIRVISARDMSRQERKAYEDAEKEPVEGHPEVQE